PACELGDDRLHAVPCDIVGGFGELLDRFPDIAEHALAQGEITHQKVRRKSETLGIEEEEIVTDPPGEIAAVASGSLADANGLGARRRSASGQHAGDVLLERRAYGREQCPLRASGGAESVDHREEHALVGRSEKEVGMKADVQVL